MWITLKRLFKIKLIHLAILSVAFAENGNLEQSNSFSYGNARRSITCDPDFSPSLRIDCGWPEISLERCEAMGCCTDPRNSGFSNCYIGHGGIFSRDKTCTFDKTRERSKCGQSGISKHDCEAMNCCYDNRVIGGIPNCFRKPITKHILETEDISRLMAAQTKSIHALTLLKDRILKAHMDYNIAKTVGSSVSLAGSAMFTAGILLAPITAGWSLGLTVGGLTAGILGGTTTFTTNIIEFVKLSQWESDLIASFAEQEVELQRIAEQIVNYPEWTDWLKSTASAGTYIAFKGGSAYTVGKIASYLSATNVQYGDTFRDTAPILETVESDLWKAIQYAPMETEVKEITIPGGFLLNENNFLNEFLGKVGLPAIRVGTTGLKCLTVGLGIFGAGVDVYTIIHTWGHNPKLVGQIDSLIYHLEQSNRKLNYLRFKFGLIDHYIKRCQESNKQDTSCSGFEKVLSYFL